MPAVCLELSLKDGAASVVQRANPALDSRLVVAVMA